MVGEIPKFNLTRITAIRRGLYHRVLERHVGERLSDSVLEEMVRDTMRAITGASRDAVYETFRVYAGELLTSENSGKLCWMIAGNIQKLRRGSPVRSWAGQTEDEWMPLQFVSVRLAKPYKDITVECVWKVLAGSACPAQVTRYLSRAALKHVARKIGFSAPWQSYPYKHIEDLTGLRLLGKFEPRLTRDGSPSFREVAGNPGILKWNREQYLRVRCRKKEQCPERYQHSCAKCAFGTDRCQFAVHPKTFELGHCFECNNTDALFDPAGTGSLCISCANRLRLGTGGR